MLVRETATGKMFEQAYLLFGGVVAVCDQERGALKLQPDEYEFVPLNPR